MPYQLGTKYGKGNVYIFKKLLLANANSQNADTEKDIHGC